jgi:uncharacterized protein
LVSGVEAVSGGGGVCASGGEIAVCGGAAEELGRPFAVFEAMREELPLQELFTRLREAGLPLGLNDYQAVVKAMQGGYGVADRASLERVCRMLWVRSADEQQLFDYYFEQSFGVVKLKTTDEKEIQEILESVIASSYKQTRLKKLMIWEVTHKTFRTLGYTTLLSGLFLGTGMIFWINSQSGKSTVPNSIINILRSTESNTDKTPVLSLSLQPLKQNKIKLPRTSEQSLKIKQWKRRIQLTNQSINLQWIIVAILVGGTVITGVMWFLRAFFQRLPKPVSSLIPEVKSKRLPKKQLKNKPQVMRNIKDEVQAAQATQRAEMLQQARVGDRNYILTHDYLPVTQRQMKQSWRYLRRFVREGVATELDVASTVRHIAQNGMLLSPVLVPPRRNQTELLLLIDQDGSMVAFHALSKRLVETAERGGRLGDANVYYFHNCPIDYLYHDPKHQQAEPLGNWFGQVSRSRSVVLIFSDAGAARGGANPDRIEETKKFLAELKQQVRYVAWLNPLPKARWEGTSAESIAQLTPMFEISRHGMDGAISALRGRGRLGL